MLRKGKQTTKKECISWHAIIDLLKNIRKRKLDPLIKECQGKAAREDVKAITFK